MMHYKPEILDYNIHVTQSFVHKLYSVVRH